MMPNNDTLPATSGAAISAQGLVDVADAAVIAEAKRRWRHVQTAARLFFWLTLAGFLVALVVPGFLPMRCRSMQAEAKGNLKALFVAEDAFFADHGRYSDDLSAIGFTPKGARLRYAYAVRAASADGYEAYAFRTDGVADDVWRIGPANDLQNTMPGCPR